MRDDINVTSTVVDWPTLPEPDMLNKLIKIIVDEGMVDPKDVKPEATLEGLGLTSIDVVNILMGVEEEFDVYVPMAEDLSSVRNLSDMIRVVVEQMYSDES